MQDHFGQDGITTEGTDAGSGTPASATTAGGTMLAPAPAAAPAVAPTATPATPPPAPVTIDQALAKATAKASADATVAAVPAAVHSVKLAPNAPIVIGSTAAGAGIGMMLGGPPGAALGAGIGWVTERYQIAGGPWGRVWNKLKGWGGKLKSDVLPSGQ